MSAGINDTNVKSVSFVCYTISTNYDLLNSEEKKRLFIINIVIAVVNFLINSLMIYAITVTKQYKIQSIKLSLYLSISDLFTSLITQPIANYQLMYGNKKQNCAIMIAFQLAEWVFPQLSVNIVSLIMFDRYVHIRYLSRYSEMMTPKEYQ